MILFIGGTGTLGRLSIPHLLERGQSVRVLTREPARAQDVQTAGVEIVEGDVLDVASLQRAMVGVRTVISAMHGFTGTGKYTPQSVDRDGNVHLFDAARRAGVEHVVLLSIQGATADHPMELFRAKFAAEEAVRASTLAWTILRPTAYMETWAALVGVPLLTNGATRIFGGGRNPINFVSAADVAQFVALAVSDPSLRNTQIDIGGPENVTMHQVVATFQSVSGRSGKVNVVPLPVLRVASVLMRLFNPTLARQMQGAIVMDTRNMTFDAAPTRRQYPAIGSTSFADVARQYLQLGHKQR